MQIIFVLLCSFFILWALEIRHREAVAKLSKAMDDTEKIKDELALITRQLRIISQKLNDIGISTS